MLAHLERQFELEPMQDSAAKRYLEEKIYSQEKAYSPT